MAKKIAAKDESKEGGTQSGAPVASKDVDKAIDKFVTAMNKRYQKDDDVGIGGVTKAVDSLIRAIPIPTIFPDFNRATGIGGAPNNGVLEISGEEGVGKTWLALQIMAQAQKLIPTRRPVLCDLEGTSDIDRLKFSGIDINSLFMIDPCMGETLFEKILEMIESELFSVILVDSIPALQPKKLWEGNFEDSFYGPIAALLSDVLRKVAPACRKHNTLLILTNQTRQKIGATKFEPQEVTTGGKAIRFYSHMRIQLKKFFDPTKKVKFNISDASGKMIGHRVTARFVKNRYGPPFQEGMFEVFYQEPDIVLEVIKQAKKAGLWKIYKGDCKYTTVDEKLIIAPSEEEFMRMLVLQGRIVEMAERLMDPEILSEEEDPYLPETFDMTKLTNIQEVERKKYEFIGGKDVDEKVKSDIDESPDE